MKITFSNYIRNERKKKNISQKELAKMIGISAQYLNDIEQNKRSPKKDELIIKIAKTLKLNFDYLFYLQNRFKAKKNKLDLKSFKKAMKYFNQKKTS